MFRNDQDWSGTLDSLKLYKINGLKHLQNHVHIYASKTKETKKFSTVAPPDKLRFKILNSESSYKIRLSMYYFTSMRIELCLNGVYVPPTNAYYMGYNLV
jgi:hypothetical protein